MRKEFVFVCTSLFLLIFGANISGTLLVPYTNSMGGNSLWVGIIYSCMYVVRLLLGTPIGRLSQRKGSKRILTYSLALYPFIAVAYLVSWNIPSLLTARFLHGIASAMMLPMAMAYMGEISPAGQEGRYMGIYNTILFIAGATGPFVGGLIYDLYGIRTAFLTLLVLAVFSFLIIILFARGKTTVSSKGSGQGDRNADESMNERGLFNNRKLLSLSILNVTTAILLSLLGASFTQLTLSYGLGMGLIGLLIALNNVVIGIAQIPFGKFADRLNKLELTIISGLLISILVLLLPAVGNLLGIALVVAVLGIFTALNLATVTALSAIQGKEAGMGNTMGFLGSVNSAGTITGFLVLGWIADTFGINNAFYFTGVVFFAGIILFYLLWNDRRSVARKGSRF